MLFQAACSVREWCVVQHLLREQGMLGVFFLMLLVALLLVRRAGDHPAAVGPWHPVLVRAGQRRIVRNEGGMGVRHIGFRLLARARGGKHKKNGEVWMYLSWNFVRNNRHAIFFTPAHVLACDAHHQGVYGCWSDWTCAEETAWGVTNTERSCDDGCSCTSLSHIHLARDAGHQGLPGRAHIFRQRTHDGARGVVSSRHGCQGVLCVRYDGFWGKGADIVLHLLARSFAFLCSQ